MIVITASAAAVSAAAAAVALRRGIVLDRHAELMRVSGDAHASAGEHVAAISARLNAFQASEKAAAAVLLAWCLFVVMSLLTVVAAAS